MNKQKCDEWAKDRLVTSPKNPLTNRKIKKNGPKYKQLDRDCKEFIVDINAICVEWLKDNHNDLYRRMQDRIPSQNARPPPRPVVTLSENDFTTDESEDHIVPQNIYFTIDDRMRLGDTIKDFFSTVIIADGKACMTEEKTLLKYVNKPKLLGYGSFGNVYGVVTKTKPPMPVAIKEGRILKSEFTLAMKKKYPLEYFYNKLVNDLIDEKICPNFSYTFAIFFCDKCKLTEYYRSVIRKCSETVVELFDDTLNNLKDINDEVHWSILFQIFYALACLQIEYGLWHNDIKKENILIKIIPPGGYWDYNINNKTYHVPNCGFIAAIADFGVSHCFKPGLSKGNYGRRQAEVVFNTKTNKYVFKPFTTKFFPEIDDKTGKLSKVPSHVLAPFDQGGVKGTWNRFWKNFDSEPSVPVDLYDMGRFPIYQFHFDIVDVFRLFLGGKRATQPGNHIEMTMKKNFRQSLKKFNVFVAMANQGWPLDRVDLFLANHTIETLFPFYTNVALKGPKIETYSLINPM